MPKTKREPISRVNIRIPEPMITEIKRIILQFPELNYNRQQFIESAIREKIERIRFMEAATKAKAPLAAE